MDRAIALGCNFFDTAWAYGYGNSEQLLGRLLSDIAASTLRRDQDPAEEPPWPARAEYALDDVFPADHIREYTENSLANLGLDYDRSAAVPRVDRRVGRATSGGSARSTT